MKHGSQGVVPLKGTVRSLFRCRSSSSEVAALLGWAWHDAGDVTLTGFHQYHRTVSELRDQNPVNPFMVCDGAPPPPVSQWILPLNVFIDFPPKLLFTTVLNGFTFNSSSFLSRTWNSSNSFGLSQLIRLLSDTIIRAWFISAALFLLLSPFVSLFLDLSASFIAAFLLSL